MAPRGVPLTNAPPRREPPTREEYDALLARVAALEARLAASQAPPANVSPAYPPPAAPQSAYPPPWLPQPVNPTQSQAPPAYPQSRPFSSPLPPLSPAVYAPPRAKKAVNVESLLGQRFAPRVGAVLVFLAAVFFLGVAIQRGWIGPLAQLALAAIVALALVAGGEWLAGSTRRFGSYPQVLTGTGVSLLYLTAFAAHAIEHFSRVTHLSEITGAVLMALVGAGTVALALRHDARLIAALGYGLSFFTARLGFASHPTLTLPYVAVLGVSLALLVARKRWAVEGLVGSILTGAFLGAFALDAASAPGPSPWVVLAASAVPAAAFVWLTLRPAENSVREGAFVALLALATIAWTSLVLHASAQALDVERVPAGALALACAAAGALAVAASRMRAYAGVPLVYAAAFVALYLLWPLSAWSHDLAGFEITAAYALGALALALAERSRALSGRVALPLAALALGIAAALHAQAQDLVLLPGDLFDGRIFGPPEAWATLLLVAAPLAFVALGSGGELRRGTSRAAFAALVLFLAIWAFAVLRGAFTSTVYLLVAGFAIFALASALRRAGGRAEPDTAWTAGRAPEHLVGDARIAATALLVFAAAKAASYDAHVTAARLPLPLAVLEAALVVASLTALHHFGRGNGAPRIVDDAGVLVAGGAAVIASFVLAYASGGAVSVLIAVTGVAYLAGGFALKGEAVYRWTGFAALGFVLLRVFLVDLRETDLVVRAGVFAVLGAILLGVGYVYARASRGEASAAPQPPSVPPRQPGAP